jgi:hypothetical protein
MPKKPSVNLSGTVHNLLQFPHRSEKVEIEMKGPDLSRREDIRSESSLTASSGPKVQKPDTIPS